MKELDNYIYWTLSEKTFDLYKKSLCLNFVSFCKQLKNKLELGEMSTEYVRIFARMYLELHLIYDLSDDEGLDYVYDYFIKEKFLIFEDAVRHIKKSFKNSYN